MIEFVCCIVLVALGVKFVLTLAEKWGILEWLQVHAPNQFFYKLFQCSFCQSFWIGLFFAICLIIITGHWYFVFIPIFSCNLR